MRRHLLLATPGRTECCRAAERRSPPQAAAHRPRRRSPGADQVGPVLGDPDDPHTTFWPTPAARTATCGGRLGSRHDQDLGPRQQLPQRDRDVARAGRHVDDQRVEVAPVDVGEELLGARCSIGPRHITRELSSRKNPIDISSGRRARAARSSCRRRPDAAHAEHVRDRVAVDVGVEDATVSPRAARAAASWPSASTCRHRPCRKRSRAPASTATARSSSPAGRRAAAQTAPPSRRG